MPAKRVVPIRRAQDDRARLETLRGHGIAEAANDAALSALLETLRAAFEAPFAALFVRHGKTFAAVAASGEPGEIDLDALKRFAKTIAGGEDSAAQSSTNAATFFAGAVVKLGGECMPAALCVASAVQPTQQAMRQLASVRDAYAAMLESRAGIEAGLETQLRRVYKGLEESGEHVVITEVDPKKPQVRRLVYCGERFSRAAGYSEDEMLAHGMRLLVGPRTNVDAIERAAAALLKHGRAHFEVELYRKDGSTFWSEWIVQSYEVPGGVQRWFALARDLTEQRDRSVQANSLRRALDESSDFVLTTEAHALSSGSPVVTYANEPFLQAFGYTEATLIGQPLNVLAGPGTDRATWDDLREHFARREHAGAEVLFYRSDGSAVWVELTAQPVHDSDDLEHWVIVARDVGRRRKTQEQLLVLSTAIQHANDAIVIYGLDSSGRRKPRVVYVNDAVLKNSGFSRDEVFTQSTGTGPRTDKAAVRMLRDKLARGESVRTRLELYRKNGSTYWAEIDARPIMDERNRVTHWISIERDISDVVARERQLERERRTFANLHAAVAELLGALDRKAVAELFFRGIDTVGECSSDKLRSPQEMGERQAVRSDDGRQVLVAAPDPDGGMMQLVLRRRDGDGFDDVTLLALRLYLQAYQAALHNVALYEEVADRRATVIELNQSKSDLIAMLAHDFKGPLASIIGFAQLLQQELPQHDDTHDMLLQIERGAYRLVDLANDTLAFSRAEQNELALDVSDRDYAQLARDAAAAYSGRRSIQVLTPQGPVTGRFDWQRMRQVVDNLISNAVKYSPTGEPVHVAVSRVGSSAVITVRDHGIGIPVGELNLVFERFGRASNAKAARIKGTGFGLYLARSIVEQHGGRIAVESRVGYGSAFTVTIPLQLPAEVGAAHRALVVDPAGDVRSFVAYTLRSNGYAVRVAENAAMARECFVPGEFGVCIIDTDVTGDPAALAALVDGAQENRMRVVTVGALPRDEKSSVDVALPKPYLTGELLAALGRRAGPHTATA